jgi:TPR repeat protein
MNHEKLELEAKQGSTVAKAILGIAYLDGVGVTPDYARALPLLEDAATHRVPRAMLALGRMHEQGLATARDVPRAKALYQAAAEAGEFLGCVYLARLCRHDADHEQALHWYRQAVAMSANVADCEEVHEAAKFVAGSEGVAK